MCCFCRFVVGEAMAAIIIAEAVTDKFGNDAMVDVLSAMKAYKARVQE